MKQGSTAPVDYFAAQLGYLVFPLWWELLAFTDLEMSIMGCTQGLEGHLGSAMSSPQSTHWCRSMLANWAH